MKKILFALTVIAAMTQSCATRKTVTMFAGKDSKSDTAYVDVFSRNVRY